MNRDNKARLMLMAVFVVVTLLVQGCSSSKVRTARAADWIWGYEEMESGATRVWLRYDDIAGYCTAEEDIAQFVIITYERVKWSDEENKASEGCSGIVTGSESSTPIFKLTGIEEAGR